MNTDTWKLRLMATENYPETIVSGFSPQDANSILRELLYGSLDRAHEKAAAIGVRTDRHEGPLAA